MPLATLTIDLEAKLANLEAGLDKAARIAEKNAATTEAAWRRAGATMAGIGATIVGAFAGVSLVEFVRSNIDAIDALNDVADATGASIENISALEDLAKRTGTTMDTVTSALVKLNSQLSDTKPDSEAARALRAIGLEAEELRKLDPAEALRRVAVALSGYADDGNKARLVQELFGKSVREVAPLLKDLGEQTQLVGKVTAEQAAEAEKVNKQLARLQADAAEAGRVLTIQLLPSITAVLNEMRTGIDVFGGFGAALLGIGTSDLSRPLAERREQIEALSSTLRRLQDEAARPGLFFSSEANAKAQAQIQALIKEQERLIEYVKRVQALNVPMADYSNEGRGQGKGEAPRSVGVLPLPQAKAAKQADQITEAQRALASYVAELQREFDGLVQLTEQQKALNLLRSLGTTGEIPQVRELVLGQAERVEKLRQQEKAEKALTAEMERQASIRRSLDEELDRLSGRAADARKRALTERFEERLKAGEVFDPAEQRRTAYGIAGISEPVQKELEKMDELSKQFARNFQDAFSGTIKQTLKGDFDDIGQAWGDLLLDMISQAAAAQLGNKIFGADFFKGGELGGWAKDALGFLGIPGFASGGDFGGGLRIVGERGPELELTGPARIFSAEQTQRILGKAGAQTGGAVQLTYAPVIEVHSRTDRGQVLQDIVAINQRGQADMLAMLKAKGVL